MLEAWNRKGKPPKKLRPYLQRLWNIGADQRENRILEVSAPLKKLDYEKNAKKQAKYDRYLTPDTLCVLVGLTQEELEVFTTERLVVPDLENKFRPKLVSWAAKLATLLHDGWTPAEIKRWSAGRWFAPNPRSWPPDREQWQTK